MRQMLTRLRAQIVKELLSVLRDPRSRFILLGPPFIQLTVFAFAMTLEVTNIRIGVYDMDNGRWSHELVQRVAAADFVREAVPVHGNAEMTDMVSRKEVLVGLVIADDFSSTVSAGGTGTVQVIVDGRSANAGQIAYGYLNRIVAGLNADLKPTALPPSDTVAVRHWFNPNLIYRWYVLPGLAGVLTMFITLLITALSISRERELGTFDQLMVSPATPLEIIAAKTIPSVLLGSILGTMMVLAGRFVFGVPFTGSFPLLIACLSLFTLSVVGIGLAISSLCATQQQAILGTFAVGVPMVLMSGFATPVENMPDVLQWMAQAIPLTHFMTIVEGSFTKALPLSDVLASAWPMAVIALVTLTGSIVFVRARLE
ncbi:ABC transporter permease [Rhodospirillaceae bacterium KN72]|uniref:Transport permease protein n=1 Tax=Pacificispira spongiicola TaxID=2729598 RepID=A0A7Y0E1S7_9PROT|nr:ABC transporter permease [Pacificispira spongiicola]NMM45662.1 ABC transporter permease [Pacificispira spongiicola]